MTRCWLLDGLNGQNEWWTALLTLERSLSAADGETLPAYTGLYRGLLAAGHDSVPAACAAELLYGQMPVGHELLEQGSLRQALELDLQRLSRLASVRWQQLAASQLGQQLPALTGLARDVKPVVSELAAKLADGSVTASYLLTVYAAQGQGWLARSEAWRWRSGWLEAIADPAREDFAGLYGLEKQTGQLRQATERWLAGGSGLNTLLYGPRGSGKSTAARSLLTQYSGQGLRMIEAAPRELERLPELLERLRGSPLKFVLFVDDLSFGADASAWQQLKTLLEGTLQAIPSNLLVLATTNRRRLVSQRFSDRPDPLDDDANAWDTLDEKMALADRFGLVISFPTADQRRYLQIVGELARARGLDLRELEADALLFARRGNGMSGRTARHFIDSLN